MSTPNEISPQAWRDLLHARSCYGTETSSSYDEVLYEVAAEIEESGSIGTADIGSLLFWKRLRADTSWVKKLMTMPEVEVRSVTAQAVAQVNDTSKTIPESASAGRRKLSLLPGFARGDALASALLFAAAPTRMAVYDKRAQIGLEKLALVLSPAPGRYGRYMALVESIRETARLKGHDWSARDVDLALYWHGGPLSNSARS